MLHFLIITQKDLSLPLMYSEMTISSRHLIIIYKDKHLTDVYDRKGITVQAFITIAFVASGAKLAHFFYVMKMRAFRFFFFLLSFSH